MTRTVVHPMPDRMAAYVAHTLVGHAVREPNGQWLVTLYGNKRDVWERVDTEDEARHILESR